jgi:hypothetical protein
MLKGVMYEDDIDKRKWMRTQKSYGPDWDAAIEFGIDISLIEQSLQLTFEERLRALEEMLRLMPEPDAGEPTDGPAPTP